MKNNVSLLWEILFLILFVCCMFTPEVSAQPLDPVLTVVQPYYNDNGPPEMYLQCEFEDRFYAVEGIRFSKKVEGGSWGPWEEGQLTVQPRPSGVVGYSCVDNSGLLAGKRYTYQVQLQVRKGGTNTQEWTGASNLRSNGAIKVWPVTKGACSESESINVLHGFNQVIEQITRRTLHEGIDITGEQTVDGECVRAPMGGVIGGYGFGGVFHLPENMEVVLDVHVNGEKYMIGFNHLENLAFSPLDKNKSIEPGTPLGEITSRHFTSTEARHTHLSWRDRLNRSKNPSEIWDQAQDMYRDPQGSWPVVEDTNSDSHAVRFRKGPHETAYLPDDGIVYGPVDLVVEARDHQSSYYPWQNPLRIGYYIQKSVEGETFVDVVQSSGEPYVLIDGTHWFGFPYSQGSPVLLSRVKKLVHIDEDHLINEVLKCKDPNTDPPPWDEWFTYIVTNTKGTQGILADLDAGQCWATDARNTETSPNGWRGLPSPDDPEDFVSMYETARLNKDAKFPDGRYRIRIRLEDYAHEVTDPDDSENGDHKHEVIVDNFLPYIEEVEVTTGGETIYEAGWVFSAGDEQLNWVYYTEPKDPTPGEALNFRVQTSETMQWLSVTLPGSQSPSYLVAAPNSQGMVWEATLYPKASNESTLTIQGQDTADNPLLAFSGTQPSAFPDQIPKPVPKRDTSGDWPAEYDALRQDTSGDTLHQLGKFLSETFAWRITTPTESLCDYDVEHGGIICTFDEGTGFTLTTLSFQALRDVGVPEAVVDSLHSLQGQRFATEQALLEAVHAQIGQEQTAQYRSLILEHAETARGRITLYPKDFAAIDGNVQYVVFGSVGQNRTTWEGTYQVPTEGSGDLALGVAWEPQETWFPFREPDPIGQQMWCEDVPDDMPGVDTNGSTPTTRDDKGPPDATTDTATLQWAITAQPNPDPAADSCQIRVTWETEDGQAIEEAGTLLIDLQPQSLCETFQDQSEPLEATATYPWEVADRLQYFGCHIADQETEHLEDVMENGARKYWPISDHEKVLEPGECRSWYKKELMFRFFPERWPSQLPQDIPFPTSPEEGDIAIHYECQWVEDVIANPFLLVYTTHWTWTYRCPTVYVEGEGRQTPLWGGWECDETITHITWECGDACVYLEEPGEFVLPVPVLERDLTLSP